MCGLWLWSRPSNCDADSQSAIAFEPRVLNGLRVGQPFVVGTLTLTHFAQSTARTYRWPSCAFRSGFSAAG
jgi:hypothetical protein